MLRFSCPKCALVLQTPDESAGQNTVCPKCKTLQQVPLRKEDKTVSPPPLQIPAKPSSRTNHPPTVIEKPASPKPRPEAPAPSTRRALDSSRGTGRFRRVAFSVLVFGSMLVIGGGAIWWFGLREDVQTLVEDLGAPDAGVRLTAAQKLAKMGPRAQSAVPTLIPMLADPDAKVCQGVALALDQIGPPSDASVLLPHLTDDHPEVRAYTAHTLATKIDPPPGSPPALRRALKDKDNNADVRRDLILALIKLGPQDTEGIIPVLLDVLDIPKAIPGATSPNPGKESVAGTKSTDGPGAGTDGAATISGNELFKQYEANEIAADGKYSGKTLQITGIVATIGKAFVGGYVSLSAPVDTDHQLQVQCFFDDKHKTELSKLSEGQNITIRGVCGGKDRVRRPIKNDVIFTFAIVLAKCEIIKPKEERGNQAEQANPQTVPRPDPESAKPDDGDNKVRDAALEGFVKFALPAVRHKDPDIRLRAVKVIDEKVTYRHVRLRAFLEALDDADKRVSAVASSGLTGIGALNGKEDYDVLKEVVTHRNAYVRALALKTMAEPDVADRAVVVRALLQGLGDREQKVRTVAREGLTTIRLDGKKDFDLLKEFITATDPEVRVFVLKITAKPDVPDRVFVVRALSAALDDSEEKVRAAASEGLTTIRLDGKSDFALLKDLDLVHHKNVDVRNVAVQALAKVELTEEAAALLAKVLKEDTETKLRQSALRAFTKPKPPSENLVRPVLLDALSDKDQPVREEALAALKLLGKPAATEVPHLEKSLKSPTLEVRIYAAYALGQLVREAKGALLAALDDSEEKVRAAALEGLADSLAHGKNVLALLKDLDLVRHKNADVRNVAVQALAKVESTKEAAALLEKVLKEDTETKVRLSALRAFTKPLSSSTRVLLDAVNDKDQPKPVREEAFTALKRIRKWSATEVPELAKLLKSPTPEVRIYAASALGQLGSEAKEAVSALADALGDSKNEVQRLAVDTLKSIGPGAATAAPKLAEVASNPEKKQLRRAALEALVAIGQPASVEALKRALQDDEMDIRKLAGDGLVQIGTKEGFAAVAKALLDEKEDAVRQALVESLAKTPGKLGALEGKDPAPALIKALVYALQQQEMDKEVWKAAEAAARKREIAKKAVNVFNQAAAEKELQAAEKMHREEYNKAAKAQSAKLGVFATALSAMGKYAVPDLRRILLQDRNPLVRWGAALALGEIGAGAKDALKDLKTSKDREREPCVAEASAQAVDRINAALILKK